MQLLMEVILKYPRTLLLCLLSTAKSVVERVCVVQSCALVGRFTCSFCIVVDLELGLLVVLKTMFEKTEGGNLEMLLSGLL